MSTLQEIRKEEVYGLFPAKRPKTTKWRRVNVDLWEPAMVKNKNSNNYKIHVMTMIDPATGWFEVAALIRHGLTAVKAQRLALRLSQWLARYA